MRYLGVQTEWKEGRCVCACICVYVITGRLTGRVAFRLKAAPENKNSLSFILYPNKFNIVYKRTSIFSKLPLLYVFLDLRSLVCLIQRLSGCPTAFYSPFKVKNLPRSLPRPLWYTC